MRASPLVLGGRQRDKMQHPLTGATCVALPNVGMCPQLSCALTFMYLQQVRRAASLGGCFPGSRTPSPRRWAVLWYLGGVWEGARALDRRAASEPLIFPGPRLPRAPPSVPLCAYFERLFPSLGNRSWNCKLPSPYSHLSRASASVVIWVYPLWCQEFGSFWRHLVLAVSIQRL